MNGLMMHQQLLISSLLTHAERHHPEQLVVSRRVEGDIHRCTIKDLAARARRMANALGRLGITRSQRVATLAWNGYRHLELYYAVSGSGAVLHTIHPRLHPDQIVYIADHAEDQVLFFDLTFLPIVEAIAGRTKTIKAFVAMTDRAHMPKESKIANLLCYEDLCAAESDTYDWPTFDENLASSMCYTSGTTGNPKGVLYSHRSTLLHTFAIALPDSLNCSALDAILPVVPMFHVNAWGLPYAAFMTGTKLVFPGPGLDGKSLYELMESEKVTLSAGVPTVWQGLLAYVEQNGLKFSTMTRTVIGGSACPLAMTRKFKETYGVHVIHAWGMTEMSPVGTVCAFKPRHMELSQEERYALHVKQGRAVFGVDMKIVDPNGKALPHDGVASGDLLVKGPWIAAEYFRGEGGDPLVDGWFPTGDVATIDTEGFMQVTDRSKDVIKSGGEWISSVDLENALMGHPAIKEAAVIAVPHPKWDERPLAVVVLKDGAKAEPDTLKDFLAAKFAKWWLPDGYAFVPEIPKNPAGKFMKSKLRDQFENWTWGGPE